MTVTSAALLILGFFACCVIVALVLFGVDKLWPTMDPQVRRIMGYGGIALLVVVLIVVILAMLGVSIGGIGNIRLDR